MTQASKTMRGLSSAEKGRKAQSSILTTACYLLFTFALLLETAPPVSSSPTSGHHSAAAAAAASGGASPFAAAAAEAAANAALESTLLKDHGTNKLMVSAAHPTLAPTTTTTTTPAPVIIVIQEQPVTVSAPMTTHKPHKHGARRISVTDKLHKFDLFIDPVCEQLAKLTEKQLKRVHTQMKKFCAHVSFPRERSFYICLDRSSSLPVVHPSTPQRPTRHWANASTSTVFCGARASRATRLARSNWASSVRPARLQVKPTSSLPCARRICGRR